MDSRPESAGHSLNDYKGGAEKFSLKNKEAYLESVYDGDTCTLVVLLSILDSNATSNTGIGSERHYVKFSCRLEGINCAELKSKDLKEKEKAVVARDYLAKYKGRILGTKFSGMDKYGRPLVVLTDGDLVINDELVRLGLAKKYNGRGEKAF